MALKPRGYRLYCNKKLDPMVNIDNDTLEFDVEGTTYIVPLYSGVYNTFHEQFESELPSMISKALSDNGVPLICKLGGVYDYADNRTILVFEHTDVTAHHDFNIIGGTAYNSLIGDILDSDDYEDGTFDAVFDLSGNILTVYPDFGDLGSFVAVNKYGRNDTFTGAITIRRTKNSSLSGSISVVSASRLEGELNVRRRSSSQIPSFIAIPTDGSYDIGSFLIVRN
ncbi:hypothetical protein [Pseudobacillus badius]|uniref:hypothetical protein n=1 Tax=Bacillus badius TaxID=1455 RepID=UPI0007B3202F|nr:hypothetical protein [Bacillus badius]KZR57898.1 hypothetical protein A3781_19165 [Bacillus badius]